MTVNSRGRRRRGWPIALIGAALISLVIMWLRATWPARTVSDGGHRLTPTGAADAPLVPIPAGGMPSPKRAQESPGSENPPNRSDTRPAIDPDVLRIVEHLASEYDADYEKLPPPPQYIRLPTYAFVRKCVWDEMAQASRMRPESFAREILAILHAQNLAPSVRGMAADLLRLSGLANWQGELLRLLDGKDSPSLRERVLAVLVCREPYFHLGEPPGWSDPDNKELGKRSPELLVPRHRPFHFGIGEREEDSSVPYSVRYPDGSATAETVAVMFRILKDSAEPEELQALAADALVWSVDREAGTNDPILREFSAMYAAFKRDPTLFPHKVAAVLAWGLWTWRDDNELTGASKTIDEHIHLMLYAPDPSMRIGQVHEIAYNGGYDAIKDPDQRQRLAKAIVQSYYREESPFTRQEWARIVAELPADMKESAGALDALLEMVRSPLDLQTRRGMVLGKGEDAETLSRQQLDSRYAVAESLGGRRYPEGPPHFEIDYPATWRPRLVTALLDTLVMEQDPVVRARIYEVAWVSGGEEHLAPLRQRRAVETDATALKALDLAIANLDAFVHADPEKIKEHDAEYSPDK